ncbi:MAG: hypothetical protein ABIZ49_13030 [Opitutaceae bacterium]
MDQPHYRRAFWKSRHHVWLALLTLGLGFASGQPLGLLAGATLYALGLVFLPDAGFFRRAIDARTTASLDSAAAAQLAEFQKQQEQLLASLSTARRTRYAQLVAVCRDIESSADAQAPAEFDLQTRRGKLDELAWTYLRMLAIEQSLEVYLETERKEQLPALVRTLEAETHAGAAEVESMKKISPRPATLDGKERLLTSRLERLRALQQRLQRIEQAAANHDIIRSEQERLVEQVKLIRADAIASKNADTLTTRLDLSIEHLAATNKWLSELAEFKDLTAQMPALPPRPAAAPAPRTRTAEPPPLSSS